MVEPKPLGSQELISIILAHPNEANVKQFYYEIATKECIDDADMLFEAVVEGLNKQKPDVGRRISSKIATAKRAYETALKQYTEQSSNLGAVYSGYVATGKIDIKSADAIARKGVNAMTGDSDVAAAMLVIATNPPKKPSTDAKPEVSGEAPKTSRKARFASEESNREIGRQNARTVGSLFLLVGEIILGMWIGLKACAKLPQPPQKEPQQNSAPAEGVKGSMLQKTHGKFAKAAPERRQPSRLENATRSFRGRVARNPTQARPLGGPTRFSHRRPGR